MSAPARVPKCPPLRDGRVLAPRGAALGRTTGARRAGTTDLEAPPPLPELSGGGCSGAQESARRDGGVGGGPYHCGGGGSSLSVRGPGAVGGDSSRCAVPAVQL